MGSVKCVIWDLDHTVWDGVCLEDEAVELRPGIVEVLQELKDRGIVQSIASKNELEALEFVRNFGIEHFFVHPMVNWNPKEESIKDIVSELNIGIDAVAFVDDQPFERDSVAAMLPGIRVYDAASFRELVDLPEFQLSHDTPEARARGQMYVEEAERSHEESAHEGGREAFLKSLELVAMPRQAVPEDITRISELVTRTNQFNSTGRRYTDDEIAKFFHDPQHRFYVTTLRDKYGDYGRCGVALVRDQDSVWSLEIVLLSCRVAGRGLGTAFLTWLTAQAHRCGAREIQARYTRTDRNRQIGLLYKILGFSRDPKLSDDYTSVFSYPLDSGALATPAWIRIEEAE